MGFLPQRDNRRKMRWFFGGVSGCCACLFTHPLDLLKVLLQTQQETKISLKQNIQTVYKNNGFRGFYNGLSAALLRQMTFTTTRFGIYEVLKDHWKSETFFEKASLAITAGMLSGMVGVPMDVVNVRMQNDVKLPPEQRRNYKHVGDGLLTAYREGGFKALFSGATFAVSRACLMSIGQNAVYDTMKPIIQSATNLQDGIPLHMGTSLFAALVATILTQPLDVVKTRKMNSKPGEFAGNLDVVRKTAMEGPMAFYKGIFPAFLRLGPQTILIFVFMEQFRLYFGSLPKVQPENKEEKVQPENKEE